MRRKILTIVILLAVIFFPVLTLAADPYGLQDTLKNTDGVLKDNVGGAKTIPELAGKIVAAGLSLFAIIFFILFLYAGFTWMKAMGSSEDVTKAKDTIQAAIIGLIIVSAAYAATKFVFTRLGASSGGGGGSAQTETHKDGETCIIQDNDWAADPINNSLIGKQGMWNCGAGTKKGANCDGGQCQPACRYNKAGAKC